MPTTANGLKAIKIKGYSRIYLVDSGHRFEMIELKPGTRIEDVDTTACHRFDDPRNTWNPRFRAVKHTRNEFDNPATATTAWYVTGHRENTYTTATKADAIRHLRMELAHITSWMWNDQPDAA